MILLLYGYQNRPINHFLLEFFNFLGQIEQNLKTKRRKFFMKMNLKLLAKYLAIFVLIALSACGKPGLVIKNGPAGPKTGDLIDPLPEGLIADKKNARHGTEDLKPDIN